MEIGKGEWLLKRIQIQEIDRENIQRKREKQKLKKELVLDSEIKVVEDKELENLKVR